LAPIGLTFLRSALRWRHDASSDEQQREDHFDDNRDDDTGRNAGVKCRRDVRRPGALSTPKKREGVAAFPLPR
jgi:hypothetical protein